uniref:Piezo transmembrane helical unit domain-containing protein n=1 Tax=Timema douglasi TaxID=61478 RepID=A0A7R8ZDP2_TIMDO|nr:unnamed protein product [Timema douglasi]
MKTPRLDQAQARSSPVHSSEDLLAAPVGSINSLCTPSHRLTEESQGVPEIRLVAPSLERGLDSGRSKFLLFEHNCSSPTASLVLADSSQLTALKSYQTKLCITTPNHLNCKNMRLAAVTSDSQNSGIYLNVDCQTSVSTKEVMRLLGVLVDESDSDSQHELSAADQPPIVQLCIAIYYSLMSHSELICYFMVFLHQIKSATILSLPLPLMVFLWGTLTVPRPTKTFWVTLIAYTETIVVVKCLFQFDLIPWNIRPILDNQPFFPPRIIGIEQKPNYATYDLALLLIIFFHRVMLKSMGLWKSSYEDPIRFPKKEETFALDSSGSDEQQTKAGEEFSDLQPSKLCESLPPIPNESLSSALRLRRGSAGSRSSSVRQVVTQGGRRLSAIRSVEDLEGETSTDLPTTQLVVVETERESALVHFPAIIKLA